MGGAFLGSGLADYRGEKLGRHEIWAEGLGKESSLSIIGKPISDTYQKPTIAVLVAVISSNGFQLLGEWFLHSMLSPKSFE